MNKRDILNMCLDKLHEIDQCKPASPIDMHYKIHERELNIREDPDPRTIH